MRQRYSYKYTLVPYKHTFLHNTNNLERLVSVGTNTEVQAHFHVFGGSFHDPHDQFHHHSRMANNGRDLGFIRATTVRFLGYFCIVHCCIRCSQPLKSTVYGSPWADLKNKKEIVVRDATYVESDLYWRQSYVVLRTVFPTLLALRLANPNKAAMDKI